MIISNVLSYLDMTMIYPVKVLTPLCKISLDIKALYDTDFVEITLYNNFKKKVPKVV